MNKLLSNSKQNRGSQEGQGTKRQYKAGYEYLLAYKITVPLYDYTVVFCKRCSSPNFPNFPNLSSSRTYDQMVQAARSGMTNIPEGNQQASLEGYIKLTGVNRGSLEELLKDYLSFARQNQLPIWGKEETVRRVREVGKVWEILKKTPTLPDSPNFPNLPDNPTEAVNLLITLTNQAIYLQKKLQQSLEEKFVAKGGFRENLFKKRMSQKAKEWEKGFIKLTKKTLILSLTLLILLPSLTSLILFFPKKAQAEWYDDNWSYRTSYSNNNTGAAVTNQKIKLDIDTTTLTTDKLQADCGDSRFTDQGGNLLKYYIDETGGACDTASTDYYVLVPTINAGRTIIYHYYGNPQAQNGTEAAQFTEATFSPASTTASSEEKGPGPVAYWRFDDGQGQTTQDATTNNNDGTLGATSGSSTDDPTWQAEDMCVSGKCLKFDGTNDYVDAGTATVTESQNLTIEFWVRPGTQSQSVKTVIDKDHASAPVQGWAVQSESATSSKIYYFAYYDGTTWQYTNGNGVVFTDNTWQHIAFVKSGTTVSAYKNGVLSNTFNATNGTISYLTNRSLYFGRFKAATGREFNGFLDDVKIYNYARSASQIQADYNSRGATKGTAAQLGSRSNVDGRTLSDGLVALWKMDEASANSCSGGVNDNCDSSGNSNDGAWNGNATSAAGKYGNGTTFDGDDYTSVGNPTSLQNLPNNNLTVSAWVYDQHSATSTWGTIFSTYNTSTGTGWTFRTVSSSGSTRALHMQVTSDGSNQSSWSSTRSNYGTIPASTWTHVVAIWDATTKSSKLYINGSEVSSYLEQTTGVGSYNADTSNTKYIGALITTVQGFNGKIDEARIYNRALSPKEVEALYNWAPGPVGYWDFEDGSGSTAADKSGNGNNGTLTVGASGTQTTTSQAWTAGNPGKIGSGLNLDGSDDYVDTNSTNFNFASGDFTAEVWVNPSTLDSSYDGLISPDSCDSAWKITREYNNSFFSAKYGSTTTYNFPTVSVGSWHHYAIVKSGTSLYLYFDGVLQSTNTVSSTHGCAAQELWFGTYRPGSVQHLFDGKMDDIKIYNYARTQKQIIEDMLGSPKAVLAGGGGGSSTGGPRGGAVAHYKFDEGQGTVANNVGYGGSSLNGTMSGFASPATSTSGWTGAGKFNKGLVFDGSDDYVNFGNSSTLNFERTNPFSISFWMKTSNSSGSYRVLGNFDYNNSYRGYGVIYDATLGRFKFQIISTWSTNAIDVGTTQNVNDNNWHHIIATYDGSSLASGAKIFIDGKAAVLVTQVDSLSATIQNSISLQAGLVATVYYTGSIDEVKIYPFALTSEEVKLEYNRGSATVLGALGDNTNYDKSAQNQEYCIPGDTTTCTAPVGRWDFNEKSGQTAYDSSGNANNGTLGANSSVGTDDPTWAVGKKGAGLSFDGTDDYVNVGDATSLNITDAIAVSLWFKINSQPSNGSWFVMMDKGLSNTPPKSYLIQYYNDGTNYRLEPAYYSGGSYHIPSVVKQLNIGEWYHMVWVHNTANDADYVYLNGINQSFSYRTGSYADAIDSGSGTNLSIGISSIGGRPFNGSIDDVRIFNYARSAAQVAWDYNRGAPIAHWKFDEGQGGTLYDSSGNGNNGTWNGTGGTQTSAGDINTSGTAWFNGKTGKRNYSLNFDGSDDYVDVGNPSILSFERSNSFTLSAWVYPTASSVWETIISKMAHSAPYTGYTLELMAAADGGSGCTRCLRIHLTNTWDTNALTVDTTSAVPLNQWSHVLATYDGTSSDSGVKLYINGVLQSTTTRANTLSSSIINSTTVKIGARTTNLFFPGQIDDVRIYNYALTGTQVKLLYNNGAINFGPSTGAP